MEITYNGITLDTKHFDGTLSPTEIQEVRENFYKGSKEKALDQLKKVLTKGQVSTNHIYAYYFEQIANNGKLYHSKFSINEVLASDELTQVFINKTKTNPKVFNSKDLTSNVKTAIRLGGKGIASKLTNFPLKECIAILRDYQAPQGQVYIDPSCGWGIRMLASAVVGLDYVGFDVNSDLVVRLKELGEDIKTIKPDFNYTIYEQGSQYFVEDLVNTSDISFTSPPYFNLEDYGNNTLETTDSVHGEYDYWLEQFAKPLMFNLEKYAKVGSPVLINVKDFKGMPLVDDFIKLGTEAGLVHKGFDTLKNNVRVNGSTTVGFKQKVDNSEQVIIFIKK